MTEEKRQYLPKAPEVQNEAKHLPTFFTKETFDANYNPLFVEKIKEDFQDNISEFLRQSSEYFKNINFGNRQHIMNFIRHIFGCFNSKYKYQYSIPFTKKKCFSTFQISFIGETKLCITRRDDDFVPQETTSRLSPISSKTKRSFDDMMSDKEKNMSNNNNNEDNIGNKSPLLVEVSKSFDIMSELDECFLEIEEKQAITKATMNNNVGDSEQNENSDSETSSITRRNTLSQSLSNLTNDNYQPTPCSLSSSNLETTRFDFLKAESIERYMNDLLMKKIWNLVKENVQKAYCEKQNKRLASLLFQNLFRKGQWV